MPADSVGDADVDESSDYISQLLSKRKCLYLLFMIMQSIIAVIIRKFRYGRIYFLLAHIFCFLP